MNGWVLFVAQNRELLLGLVFLLLSIICAVRMKQGDFKKVFLLDLFIIINALLMGYVICCITLGNFFVEDGIIFFCIREFFLLLAGLLFVFLFYTKIKPGSIGKKGDKK